MKRSRLLEQSGTPLFGDADVVPFRAGESVAWRVVAAENPR